VNLLSAVHQLAWTQHPTIWLCESCAIWAGGSGSSIALGSGRRSAKLCGLMLKPGDRCECWSDAVVGIPHSASSEPDVASRDAETRLAFLADKCSWTVSVGDLVMLSGHFNRCDLPLSNSRRSQLNCKRLDGFSEVNRLKRQSESA